MIIVGITCETRDSAKRISRVLLEKRLIACSNIFPVESFFWWKGSFESSQEVFLMCKSLDSKYHAIKEAVEEIHEYDVPLIEAWKVDYINEDYEKFLNEEVEN